MHIICLSLLMGLSFLIGFFLSKTIKNKFMTYFSTGLAFIILLAVLFTDIIPELYELTSNYYLLLSCICGETVGMLVLVLLDLFVPHHHHLHKHNDDAKHAHKDHLYHIGFLTYVSVIMHNILEGMAFYLVAKGSVKAGILMAGGIALHNIPLGIEIAYFFKRNKNSNNMFKYLTLILSGTLGTFIGMIVGDLSLIVNIAVLSITCGMIMYTSILELGVESFNNIKEKGVIEGLLVGAIIFALLLM